MSSSAAKPDPTPVPASEVRAAPAAEEEWDIAPRPKTDRAPAWLGEIGGANSTMDAQFEAGLEFGDDAAAEIAAIEAGTHPVQRARQRRAAAQ